jgi:hypothetical protein
MASASFAGWYYKRDGQRHGPFSTAEVRSLVASGRLHPSDPVWGKWVDGDDCRLAAALARAALDIEIAAATCAAP